MKKILAVTENVKDLIQHAGGTALNYLEDGNEVYLIAVCEQQNEVPSMELTSIEYLNFDTPFEITQKTADILASAIRRISPNLILTYGKTDDPEHPSHNRIREYVMASYQAASGSGFMDGQTTSPRQTPMFGIEHIGMMPDIYIDITDTIDQKVDILKSLHGDAELARSNAYVHGAECERHRHSGCRYAEVFSSFGSIAKTGNFIW